MFEEDKVEFNEEIYEEKMNFEELKPKVKTNEEEKTLMYTEKEKSEENCRNALWTVR